MISSTQTLTSKLMPPSRSGGITRRSAFIGGSVTTKTTSRPIAATPAGRQDRAKLRVVSTIRRAMISR